MSCHNSGSLRDPRWLGAPSRVLRWVRWCPSNPTPMPSLQPFADRIRYVWSTPISCCPCRYPPNIAGCTLHVERFYAILLPGKLPIFWRRQETTSFQHPKLAPQAQFSKLWITQRNPLVERKSMRKSQRLWPIPNLPFKVWPPEF